MSEIQRYFCGALCLERYAGDTQVVLASDHDAEVAEVRRALTAEYNNEAAISAELTAENAALRKAQDSLFAAIAHGDDKHREWLKQAIDSHFSAALSPIAEMKP